MAAGPSGRKAPAPLRRRSMNCSKPASSSRSSVIEHRPRRERKHAQREEVDDELLGLRSAASFRRARASAICDASRFEDACADVGRGHPVTAEKSCARALGMMRQLADDVAGQSTAFRQLVELQLRPPVAPSVERGVGRRGCG